MSKCTDCEEYNQDKHYCPKFCDVIRDTTKEIQEFYKGEHEKLERIEKIVKDNCNFKGERTAHDKYVKIAEIILEKE